MKIARELPQHFRAAGRLFAAGNIDETSRDLARIAACRKQEGHGIVSQRVSQRVDGLAPQVDIEDGAVDPVGVAAQGFRLGQGGRRADHRHALVFQRRGKFESDQIFILYDEDTDVGEFGGHVFSMGFTKASRRANDRAGDATLGIVLPKIPEFLDLSY